MSEDAQQHEPILNFQRMYCTVCLFLQAELSEIHTEKRSEEALFHLPHKPTSKDCRKGPGCQNRPQSAPLDALKTRPRGLRIQSSFKITFCAGHSLGRRC